VNEPLDPTVQFFVDAVPRVLNMLPGAAPQVLAVVAVAAGSVLKLVAELAQKQGFDARAAIIAADASVDLAEVLKFPPPGKT
jgi:hypothetical protein